MERHCGYPGKNSVNTGDDYSTQEPSAHSQVFCDGLKARQYGYLFAATLLIMNSSRCPGCDRSFTGGLKKHTSSCEPYKELMKNRIQQAQQLLASNTSKSANTIVRITCCLKSIAHWTL
jgi:hypothetical protein